MLVGRAGESRGLCWLEAVVVEGKPYSSEVARESKAQMLCIRGGEPTPTLRLFDKNLVGRNGEVALEVDTEGPEAFVSQVAFARDLGEELIPLIFVLVNPLPNIPSTRCLFDLPKGDDLGKENVRHGFYGQEINLTTYNLARINMFLHDINYADFNLAHGDTLLEPAHWDDEPFEAIVSNPPYSIKWDGDANPLLINDERFAPAGVLAPKSKADLAFTMHILSWLAAHHPNADDASAIADFAAANRAVIRILQTPTTASEASEGTEKLFVPISVTPKYQRAASQRMH